MKHKVGDTVRIQSKEWMDAQEKTSDGNIVKNRLCLSKAMFMYAGRTTMIKIADSDGTYKLDIDNEDYWWGDWMFDPDYSGDGPLEAEEAIRAMLDGDTLYDREGKPHRFSDDEIEAFMSLSRRPPKRKRPMTQWEVLDWANSEASRGWVVKEKGNEKWMGWRLPHWYGYLDDIERYQLARLLPDLSGVDESTIQGFEVEE